MRFPFPKLIFIVVLQMIFVSSLSAQYNFKSYYTRAMVNIDEKNYKDAITNLNICILAQPNNPEVYFYRAACKYSLSDHIGAEQDFTMALQSYSRVYYDAYRYRSMVRYMLGKYQGAISDVSKVIEKQPKNALLYVERAFFYLANNNFNEAIADCDKALSLKVIGEDAYFCKAVAEDALAIYEDALRDYNTTLKKNPKNIDAYVRRGITKSKMGNYGDAIDDYNLALKLDTAYTFAFYNRAEAFYKLNEKKKAFLDYDTVILYEPRNSYAYFNRAVMYANEQQNQQAISDFDKVLLLNPDNIRALSNRAKLKQNTADYKGAIADYNRIIELYPYFLEAYYHRSQVKTLTGDLEGAKKDMETGKLMSELNYSKSAGQLKMDSIMLNKLSYLSGEFNSSSDLIADTINLGFRPIFYLTAKDSSNAGKYYSSLLENYNPGRLKPLYLSNKTTDYYDTAIWKSNSGIENTEMQLYTAIHFTNMQLCNEAATLYDKIISEESQNALALFARGVNTCREIELLSNANEPYFLSSGSQTVYENERHEKCLSAKEDFAKALLLAPDFSFAYFNLAYIKCLLGDYYGALYDYEQAIKLNPAFADAFYNYGFLLFYLDHKKESCRNMSRAGELGLSEAFMFMKKYCVGVIDK